MKPLFERYDNPPPPDAVMVTCDHNDEPHELRRTCKNPKPLATRAMARIDVLIILSVIALVSVMYLLVILGWYAR